MPSVVDICNRALDKLGHGAITSLDDGVKASDLCNRAWPIMRDQVLRDHPWNFAITRTSLAPSSESPDWGFTYKHPLPSDCLRVLEVRDLKIGDYQLESNAILADDSVLYIRYIKQVTDPNEYDSLFVDAIAARLAHELSEALTQSNSKRQAAWEEYQEALFSARITDARENPPSAIVEDDWVLARY